MKVHLIANKGLDGRAPFARCAARSMGGGKVRLNSRTTYAMMGSKLVRWDEFKATPAADRCAHCQNEAMTIINRKRKVEGKEPLLCFPG